MAISLIINGKEAALKKGPRLSMSRRTVSLLTPLVGNQVKKRTLKFKLLTCHSAFFYFSRDD